MLQKSNESGYEVLPHPPYSPDLSPTDHLFKQLNNFLQGKHFHNQQEAEDTFQEFIKSQSTDFYAIEINYNDLLLLGIKTMTNLDCIFKSRDVTLPTKVCLVKAMVFPVVMFGCESWTIKKAER